MKMHRGNIITLDHGTYVQEISLGGRVVGYGATPCVYRKGSGDIPPWFRLEVYLGGSDIGSSQCSFCFLEALLPLSRSSVLRALMECNMELPRDSSLNRLELSIWKNFLEKYLF